MTDRVDAPGRVVLHENSNQAAPDHAGERTHPGHGDQTAEDGGDQYAQNRPDQEGRVDESEHRLRSEIGHVLVHRARRGAEEPADVRMPEVDQEAVLTRGMR